MQGLEPGWSSLMFVLLFVGGIIMILLGFIGIYIGFIFQEVKRRPIYLIRQTTRAGPQNRTEHNAGLLVVEEVDGSAPPAGPA
jgi:dolichol-phosphate mannosyltransferase